MNKNRSTEAFRTVPVYILLLLFAVVFMIPFIFMFLGSFKTTAEIFSNHFFTLPKNGFHLLNYKNLFIKAQFGTAIKNSIIISVSYTAIILFLGSLGGYVFAKMKFPGRDVFFTILLITMMIPPQGTFIPLFMILSKIHLVNTYPGIVVPRMLQDFGLPFSIFLMRQYSTYIPNALIDSAKIDACTDFQVYSHIVLPMLKSSLLVVGLVVFMASWNDFTWPLIVINDQSMYTVSLTISRLFGTQREVQWGQIMAACFMSSLPLIILFITFRKSFINGIMEGAVK